MAASALSSSYLRPAPSIVSVLQNAKQCRDQVKKSSHAFGSLDSRVTAMVGVASSRICSNSCERHSPSALVGDAVKWEQRNVDCWRKRARRGICAQAALLETAESSKLQTGTWTWTNEGRPLNIHYMEQSAGEGPSQTLLLLPSLSDVSTTDEWRAVAEDLVSQSGSVRCRAVVVDWPGLGLSDRPAIEYTVQVLEHFLVDFVSASDGPLKLASGEAPVIIGGGHAASIAAKAVSSGAIKARALVLVAPTWAGPLPIVFGRSPRAEIIYGLLRNTLRSPGVGWAMYKYLVSSPKNIRLQYLTHVYADADNVTPAVVENRTALTQREGARYAPAAFLTGLLDPVQSREEFLSLFAELEGKLPVLVLSTSKSPRRSRAEMEALNEAKGVTKYVRLRGALLPQEEYPEDVFRELQVFLKEL